MILEKKEKRGYSSTRLKVIVPGASAILAALLLLGVGYVVSTSQSDSAGKASPQILENGVTVPLGAESSGRGIFLDGGSVPFVDSCEKWESMWPYNGPAISFSAAQKYPAVKIQVSTAAYLENYHLDSNGDGVICFHEDYESPVPAYAWEPWISAVDSVRRGLPSTDEASYPIDFASSPNSSQEHAEIIRNGVKFALNVWAPYIGTGLPMPTTLVHPNDKEWFLRRTSEIGDRMEQWWDYTDGKSHGAVGSTPSGTPTMYFMASDGFPPPSEDMNYYVHEVTHFFETLNLVNAKNPVNPCWFVEGPATFIGYSLAFPKDTLRTIEVFSQARLKRAKIVLNHYSDAGNSIPDLLQEDIINLPLEDENCQHGGPALGYNLGMFVAEKLITDFGFDSYIQIVEARNQLNLDAAFESVVDQNYQEWVSKTLVPHLVEELGQLAKAN